MLLRILILVFAFNAMIPSAYAIGAMSNCQMTMDDSQSSSDVNSMEVAVSTMPCKMVDMDENCTSIECLSNCSINISTPLPLSHEQVAFFNINLLEQPQSKIVYFYHIILPIITPPPLV